MKFSVSDFKNNKDLLEKISELNDVKEVNAKEVNAKEVSVMQVESNINIDNITSMNDIDNINKWYITNDEVLFMKELYSEINTYLYKYSTQAIDEYDYKGSPIYNESGITRETLAQIIDRVIELGYEHLEQIEEIKLERDIELLVTGKYWGKWDMLRANIQSILLNEIFVVRRPKYYN